MVLLGRAGIERTHWGQLWGQLYKPMLTMLFNITELAAQFDSLLLNHIDSIELFSPSADIGKGRQRQARATLATPPPWVMGYGTYPQVASR